MCLFLESQELFIVLISSPYRFFCSFFLFASSFLSQTDIPPVNHRAASSHLPDTCISAMDEGDPLV